MNMLDPNEYIPFAEELANLSGQIIRKYYNRDIPFEVKEDASPVTKADKEVERSLRAYIRTQYPDHGIIGEEFEDTNPDADYLWYLDPIDGTKSFMIRRPIFGTLISLIHNNQPILGLIDQPILGERWTGAKGYATNFNHNPTESRSCGCLAEAVLCTTSPNLFSEDDFEKFERIRKKSQYTVYGGDCYSYGLVARGDVDIVIETGLQLHDFLAFRNIIEGAKAIITDWDGHPITTESDGRVIVAGDKRVHAEALKLLKG